MSCLVNYDTVDTVVIGNIVFEIKCSLKVKITGDVDSRAVNNSSLIVLAIVFNSSTEVSQFPS